MASELSSLAKAALVHICPAFVRIAKKVANRQKYTAGRGLKNVQECTVENAKGSRWSSDSISLCCHRVPVKYALRRSGSPHKSDRCPMQDAITMDVGPSQYDTTPSRQAYRANEHTREHTAWAASYSGRTLVRFPHHARA